MNDYLLIAEIKLPVDTEGFVSLKSYSDFTERFLDLKKVFIDVFGSKKEFFVEKVLIRRGEAALKFKNFDSREDVDFLVGKKVFVENADAVKLDENTFFIHDIIGSNVYRNGELLGQVEEVFKLPANDIYVVRDVSSKSVLIPAVKDFIKSFDPAAKIMELVPDCDLLYDDEN